MGAGTTCGGWVGTTCGGRHYLWGLGRHYLWGLSGHYLGGGGLGGHYLWGRALPVWAGRVLPVGVGWAGMAVRVPTTAAPKTQNCFQNTYYRKRPLLQICITCEPLPFLKANFVVQNCDFPTCLVYSGRQTAMRGNMTGASPRTDGRDALISAGLRYHGSSLPKTCHMKGPIPYKGPRVYT